VSGGAAGQEDLRLHLRSETIGGGATVVVRGGPDSLTSLARHVRRTARAFALDGVPVWGISVFAAVDDLGPASLNGILAGRLTTYALVHLPTVGALAAAEAELLPTFGRPHFTLRLASDEPQEVAQLLAALGPPQVNPYHGGPRRRRR
jgi:hypothetical protein